MYIITKYLNKRVESRSCDSLHIVPMYAILRYILKAVTRSHKW